MKEHIMAKAVKQEMKKHPYEEFLEELNELEGFSLLLGKDGKPKAIQIELLEKYADLFEDFIDAAMVRARRKDRKTITLAQLKANLKADGIL